MSCMPLSCLQKAMLDDSLQTKSTSPQTVPTSLADSDSSSPTKRIRRSSSPTSYVGDNANVGIQAGVVEIIDPGTIFERPSIQTKSTSMFARRRLRVLGSRVFRPRTLRTRTALFGTAYSIAHREPGAKGSRLLGNHVTGKLDNAGPTANIVIISVFNLPPSTQQWGHLSDNSGQILCA